MYWLSYGGGVNSTALAVLLIEDRVPGIDGWQCVFADTGDEKAATYAYIAKQFRPYLARHKRILHVCSDKESVLERWERLSIVGSRILRSCTSHAKIRPITKYICDRDKFPMQLIGIDADEPGRAKPSKEEFKDIPKRYPLIEMGIGREACAQIVLGAGLCLPPKSACWHCPFARKREVLDLCHDHPDLVERIAELEEASMDLHPTEPGKVRAQWGERPARSWLALAKAEREQGRLPIDLGSDPDDAPCGCYDG